MQLRGGSDAQGRRLEVLHLAQLVAEGIDARARTPPGARVERFRSEQPRRI